MRAIIVISTIIFLAGFLAGILLLSELNFRTTSKTSGLTAEEYSIYNYGQETKYLTEKTDSYPSEYLHWKHMPITYTYKNIEQCYPKRIELAEKALKEIEILTDEIIKFRYVEKNADITFKCSKTSNIKAEGSYVSETLGEASIDWDASSKTINSAEINLLGGVNKECVDYPNTELHEVLHAFGIEHNKNNHIESIMNSVQQKCLRKINLSVDSQIFMKLKKVYSQS